LEVLLEIVGALIGLKVAWAIAEGGAMDVDQASALLVVAVLAARLLVRVVRQCWIVHHEGQLVRSFPPDR